MEGRKCEGHQSEAGCPVPRYPLSSPSLLVGEALGGEQQQSELSRERSRRMGGHLLLELAHEDAHDLGPVLLAHRVAEVDRHHRLLQVAE